MPSRFPHLSDELFTGHPSPEREVGPSLYRLANDRPLTVTGFGNKEEQSKSEWS